MGRKTIFVTLGTLAAGVSLVPLFISATQNFSAKSVEPELLPRTVVGGSELPDSHSEKIVSQDKSKRVNAVSPAYEIANELPITADDSITADYSEFETLNLQLINPATGDETNLSIKLKQTVNQRQWPHNVYTPGNLGTPPEPGSAYTSSWN